MEVTTFTSEDRENAMKDEEYAGGIPIPFMGWAQIDQEDTEKMLRATEGLVILSFLSPVFPSRIVRPCVLRTDKQEACRSTCDPMNTCNLAMKKEQFAIKYLPCFWC